VTVRIPCKYDLLIGSDELSKDAIGMFGIPNELQLVGIFPLFVSVHFFCLHLVLLFA